MADDDTDVTGFRHLMAELRMRPCIDEFTVAAAMFLDPGIRLEVYASEHRDGDCCDSRGPVWCCGYKEPPPSPRRGLLPPLHVINDN